MIWYRVVNHYRCTVNVSLQNLKIIDLQMPDFLRTLENSVQFGTPVLLQNIQEELDPSLGPILNKSLIKQGGNIILKCQNLPIKFSVAKTIIMMIYH